MYVVFARKYRPQRFGEVLGQEHIATTLQNAVRADHVAHAYLFCGSRGVGKTTMARILAKALNCQQGPTPDPCCECTACRRIAIGEDMDVMEIDGASNRGIDEVRSLRQNVRLSPAHSRFKIYYIDEVHMLTGEAFNALLKTLEEPPGHVKFIFSTTDAQRLPETVRSRCQRFDFRRIPDAAIVRLLEEVCAKEGLQVEPGVTAMIARAARGSMRDALGTLDQLAVLADKATMKDAQAVLGAVDRQVLADVVDAVAEEDAAAVLHAADAVLFGGTDVEDFADQLSQYLRDLLVAAHCGADDPLLAGSVADRDTLERQSARFSTDQITYMIQLLREAKLRARRDTTGRIALELALIKMCRLADLVRVEDALAQLAGSPASAPAADRPQSTGPGAATASGPAAVGALRRMSERLKGNRRPGSTDLPEAAVPEGVDPAKYRQLAAIADEPGLAREALSSERLRRAFVEADRAVGLSPVRLERLGPKKAREEPEEEPPADSEQD